MEIQDRACHPEEARQRRFALQARYFDFICRHSRDVSDKLRYIHENPAVAGLVSPDAEWRWSSAAYYSRTAVPTLVPDIMEFSGDPNELLWPAPWRPS